MTSDLRAIGRSASPIILIMVLFATTFIGADIVSIELRLLESLRISFPSILLYTHFIAPFVGIGVWLLLRRRFPKLSQIAAFLLCIFLIEGIVFYRSSRVDSVPIQRYLSEDERQALSARLPFPFVEQASTGEGDRIFVEKGNGRIERTRLELSKLGVPTGG
jgi:hypothetical protein